MSVTHLSQLVSQCWGTILCFTLTFLGSNTSSFCYPGHHIRFSHCVVSWGAFLTLSFPECRGFWWSWQFWGAVVRHLPRCPSFGIWQMFLSWLDWGYGFWERRPQRPFTTFAIAPHVITSLWRCKHWHGLLVLNVVTPPGRLSDILPCEVTFYSLFGRNSLHAHFR